MEGSIAQQARVALIALVVCGSLLACLAGRFQGTRASLTDQAVASGVLTAAAGLPLYLPASCEGDLEDYDVITGTDGDDVLEVRRGKTLILGYGGNDSIRGGNGADCLDGGSGDDSIEARQGGDVVLGGPGNDTINGGVGADSLYGEEGDDAIYGEQGGDYIDGGPGNDICDGGNGNNSFANCP